MLVLSLLVASFCLVPQSTPKSLLFARTLSNRNNWARPVHGSWGSWVSGECSATCGKARRRLYRQCNNPPPSNGGQNCFGPSVIQQTCKLQRCDDEIFNKPDIEDTEKWSSWSACSGSCGMGTRKRIRPCSKTPSCSDSQIESCYDDSIPPCPIDGSWTRWVQFSSCPRDVTRVCKYPRKYQEVFMRFCSAPYPAYGGKGCQGSEFRYKPCLNYYPECAKAHWSHWTSSRCSVTCGTGYTRKKRICIGDDESERKCVGVFAMNKVCQLPACPKKLATTRPFFLPTSWTAWETKSECDVKCGDGVKHRHRICVPEVGPGSEKGCIGPSDEMVTCLMQSCSKSTATTTAAAAVKGDNEGVVTVTLANNGGVFTIQGDNASTPKPRSVYTMWTPWSECDEKCKKRRSRECLIFEECFDDDETEVWKCEESECPSAQTSHAHYLRLSPLIFLFCLNSF